MKVLSFILFLITQGSVAVFSDPFKLTSSAFQNNSFIPVQYTAQGKDISPPLAWQGVPKEALSLALIYDDPDAPHGTWTHWVLYNILPTLNHIDEGGQNLPTTVRSGKNSWGKLGYGGPNPPSGTHHYHFTLYALDKVLDLKEGATRDELHDSMKGHILNETTLIGLYKRE